MAQGFEHSGPRPIEVGAVLEQDIDERIAEERIAPHHPRSRHRQELGGKRVSHLVFDDAGRLAWVLCVHDHLYVGEVRNRVHRRPHERIDAGSGREHRSDKHQSAVVDAPIDDTFKHRHVVRSMVMVHVRSIAVGPLGRAVARTPQQLVHRRPQIAFRVDQELRGGHHPLAGPKARSRRPASPLPRRQA